MSPAQGKSYMIYVSPEGLSNIMEKVKFMEFVHITQYILFEIKLVLKSEKTVYNFNSYLYVAGKYLSGVNLYSLKRKKKKKIEKKSYCKS